ncbi:MAG: carbohydrate ABC transporter permease [Chloroflexi bacterium]|jgi:multiple sugar transport system permease protein|nr:carbohydrate ABC transporter permease [Chloroflexota bacterium]MBT4003016.1 carbohydrate ABC transporter permease [Chloroflexota bacterium]MBT4306616.1 carbohydrate ABC transporter permease [Chloroflexota bacterium]MBT4533883.1 carbohydrate ABC transporter permease [Chloroflexota bacterium]MBT4681889.1 carbohydrate ABC transporter permease [Chloroflexota bacterium]
MAFSKNKDLESDQTKYKSLRNKKFFGLVLNRTVVYVILMFLAVITLLPLMWAVAASFTPLNKVFEYTYPFQFKALLPNDFTWEAYQNLFDRGMGNAIKNSLILAFSSVFFGGIISALAGFAFGSFDFKGKNFIFAIVVITFMIPTDIIAIPSYMLVRRLGWLNSYTGLIVPSLAHGMAIFLFTQFFKGFPKELLEAARVDGASWFRIFLSIVLPNSKPVILSASLLLFVGQWGSFFWPLLVAPTPKMQVVQMAVATAQGEYRTLWNELMAGALIAAIIPILIIMPFQRYYIEGISGTGVKG